MVFSGAWFKNQIDMYRSISENYEIQKKKSHEFKNHIYSNITYYTCTYNMHEQHH